MAIYSFNGAYFGRGGGQSAVAKAAYQSGETLRDQLTGDIKDYSYKSSEVLFTGIYAPKHAPAWAKDRESLWNSVEQREVHPRAEFGRRFVMALPHELTKEQNRYLLQDFVRENFVRKCFAADVALHAPDQDGDPRNIHSHILVTARKINADGWEKTKDRPWKTYRERDAYRAEEFEQLRASWARLTNRHLQRHGHEARVDHRSLDDQGINREPTQHLGPTATAMQRCGKETVRAARQAEETRERQMTRHELERLLRLLEELQSEAQSPQHEDTQKGTGAQTPELAYHQMLEQQRQREHEHGLRR